MRTILVSLIFATCVSCAAVRGLWGIAVTSVEGTGRAIATVADPTATPEEKEEAEVYLEYAEESEGYLGFGNEGDAAGGIAALVLSFLAGRKLKKSTPETPPAA